MRRSSILTYIHTSPEETQIKKFCWFLFKKSAETIGFSCNTSLCDALNPTFREECLAHDHSRLLIYYDYVTRTINLYLYDESSTGIKMTSLVKCFNSKWVSR